MSTTKPTQQDEATPTETESTHEISDQAILESTPSTKPVLVKLGTTVITGLLLLGVVVTNPNMFGGNQIANVIANVVVMLAVIGIIRLGVRLYVLTRTRYYVTPEGVRREYTLLYRTWSRELPLSMIRGHELTRSRIETLFGVGTVEFLSGSVPGSIGHLSFDHLPNPEETRKTLQKHLG